MYKLSLKLTKITNISREGVLKLVFTVFVAFFLVPSISFADFVWSSIGSNSGQGFGECANPQVTCIFSGSPYETANCTISDELSGTSYENYVCNEANLGQNLTERQGTSCVNPPNTGTWSEDYYECQWSGPITLTTSISSGQGTVSAPGISCPGDCSENFSYGTWVTIVATPDSANGYSFGSWAGACLGQTSICSVQMNGSRSTSVSFNAPAAPTVSLNASPNPVSYNSASNLSWSSSNATSCTASGAWSGSKALSGTQSTGNLISDQTYTLTCNGAGGSASRSVTVGVLSGGMSVSCSANPTTALLGQNITWTATVSGGVPPYTYSWAGTDIPTTPAPSTNPYTRSYSTIGQKNATVTVTGGNSAQATCPPAVVQINFNPDFEEF